MDRAGPVQGDLVDHEAVEEVWVGARDMDSHHPLGLLQAGGGAEFPHTDPVMRIAPVRLHASEEPEVGHDNLEYAFLHVLLDVLPEDVPDSGPGHLPDGLFLHLADTFPGKFEALADLSSRFPASRKRAAALR